MNRNNRFVSETNQLDTSKVALKFISEAKCGSTNKSIREYDEHRRFFWNLQPTRRLSPINLATLFNETLTIISKNNKISIKIYEDSN